MEAGKRSISDIFNGHKILEIPFFQRSYVWEDDQWERFLNDMAHVSQTRRLYFLGSLILKQKPTGSNDQIGDRRTVIDGQQRLTTLCIFFKVLSLKIKDPYAAEFLRIRSKEAPIALEHNHNDIAAFNSVLDLDTLTELAGDDNITKAYQYFSLHANPDQLNYNNILNNIMFVGIDLTQDEDEQQIFDTINSLGVKLTTAELLKNYFFNRHDIQRYRQDWLSVFEKDNETKKYWDMEITAGRMRRSFIDLLFYSFLQIKVQDPTLKVVATDKEEFTKLDGLFDSYKAFIKKYVVEKFPLIAEIKEYAALFREHFATSVLSEDLSDANGLERILAIIFGLENTTLIPYVFYVLKNITDPAERQQIFQYLESYLLRRIVCRATSKNYSTLFTEQLIANRILTKNDLQKYLEKQSDKANYMPTDSDLQDGFRNSVLINKQATGVLYFLESRMRDKKRHASTLLGLDGYSLEHVMPKKWENKWPSVADERSKNERNKRLLTLGNLTLLPVTLNISIRDNSWDVKKHGNNGRDGLTKYASGLETFSGYLDEPSWDEQVIASRANFLYLQALKIWPEK